MTARELLDIKITLKKEGYPDIYGTLREYLHYSQELGEFPYNMHRLIYDLTERLMGEDVRFKENQAKLLIGISVCLGFNTSIAIELFNQFGNANNNLYDSVVVIPNWDYVSAFESLSKGDIQLFLQTLNSIPSLGPISHELGGEDIVESLSNQFIYGNNSIDGHSGIEGI